VSIVGVGTPFWDFVIRVMDDYLKAKGFEKGTMREVSHEVFVTLLKDFANPFTPSPGGSCLNTLKVLQALGNPCKVAGVVGTDEIAKFLRQELVQRGIETHLEEIKGETGQLLCYVTPDGERTMRNFFGVAHSMAQLEVEPSFFDGARLLHMDGYTFLYPGLCERVMQIAKSKGLIISFDLAVLSAPQMEEKELERLRHLLKEYVDIVFANEVEASKFTGKEDPNSACLQIQTYCPHAIVTMGEEGGWVADKQGIEHYSAVSVKDVVDTTGAGDLLVAGVLHRFLEGKSLLDGADLGTKLAAEVIQMTGADLPPQKVREILLQNNL